MDQTGQTITPTTTDAAPDERDAAMMHLLHEHVPLSLLVDLAEPGTFDSQAIFTAEGEPADRWWETGGA